MCLTGPDPSPHKSRASAAARSGPSPGSSSATGQLGTAGSGNSTCRSIEAAISTARCPYAVAWSRASWVVARKERKCGVALAAATSRGRAEKKPGSTESVNDSVATVAGVGRFAPDSQAAIAVALFSVSAARSLFRRPANWRASVSRLPSKNVAASTARLFSDPDSLTRCLRREHLPRAMPDGDARVHRGPEV
jgi:hypothetical protein